MQDEVSTLLNHGPAGDGDGDGDRPERGWLGRLELAFERPGDAVKPSDAANPANPGGRAAMTRLTLRRHEGPLRLLRLLASDDARRVEAVIVHPPGGLAAGDRLRLDARAGDGTAVVLTTPGAQKWYRSTNRTGASVDTRLVLDEGAVLDWLPQPSILFDGARASQSLILSMAASASTLGWEMMVRGRAAMGEQWRTGSLDQLLEIQVDGRLWWRQRLLAEAGDRLFASPLGWRDRRCAVAVWFCAPSRSRADTEALRDRWRERLAAGVAQGPADARANSDAVEASEARTASEARSASGNVIADASAVTDGLVLAQLLGDDIESLQRLAIALWQDARDGASTPRIWQT